MASTFFVRSALFSLAATGLLVSASTGAFADPKERPSTGALNGRRIFVSAGHGKHWKDATGTFSFDRGLTHGVREDISNAQTCIDFLIPMLIDAGAEVVTGRERSYQTNEVIVDNDSNGSPDYVESGAWNNGSAPGYRTSTQDGFGLGTYRHASTVTGAPTAIARFAPNIPEAGRYPVYIAWTANSNRPADTLVKVNHAGGTTQVRLDQRSQGSRWFFCGSFFFDAGRQGSVEVTNSAGQAGKAVIADAVRFGSGMGSIIDNGRTSGIPRWQEHGRYKALYSGGGHLSSFSHLRTVPEFANWWGGHDAYIMWHSNAGGGKGTVSFYYDSSHALSPESRRLAESVHRGVIADAKHHDSNWTDRGFRNQLANWTEMFYTIAHRPVMLCEVAFHDHVDDAEDLRDPKFRRAAARGAVKGFIRYFNGANSSVPPVPPTGVQVVNVGGGIMRVTWNSAQDPVDSTAAAPTGARVYLSLNGRGFDDGWAVTSGQSFDVSGVQPGEILSVKVTQTNAGGESRPSEVLCARRPVGGNAPEFLIVNGFDRLDERVNVRDRVQTFDYVRQHAEGLAGAGDFAFDSASNEAVVSGAVQLDAYQAVVWVLGQESTVDKTFDSAERTLVSSYLAGGGKLIASGAEIAWDLDHKGADRTWFRQTFGAAYGADDAKTHQGTGESGTLFGGVNF
ncbi:MAG: golvesin C-terminal-like domain-containing protein, partial [Planctomycetota bacterium]